MWYFDYHGFEATRNGTPTSNIVRIRTGYLLANQDIPPSYSFKLLQSWTFFRYFHPLPQKRVRFGILLHMPRNTLTYTRRHTFSTVLTGTMSPKRKMASPMRSAAIWRLGTFRCRNSKERSVELISREIKYFCAACLDRQCRSIKFTRSRSQPYPGILPLREHYLALYMGYMWDRVYHIPFPC